MKLRIITAAAIKGGTGKTTSIAALAQAATAAGKKALAIDLDPQANLTAILGAARDGFGSMELLQGAEASDLIQHTKQGVDVISGSPYLATVKTRAADATQLREALDPIREEYQFIFIDTPPTIGAMTFEALQASTGLIVPLEADSSSIQGLFQIVDVAKTIKGDNPSLAILGSVLTRYDKRPKLNRACRDLIAEKGKQIGAPLIAEIRPSVTIREAQAMRVSLYEYAPKSNPAEDYKALYSTILRRG